MSGHACRGNHKCSQIEATLQKLDLVQTNALIKFSCYYQKCMKNLKEHSTDHLVTFKSNIVR